MSTHTELTENTTDLIDTTNEISENSDAHEKLSTPAKVGRFIVSLWLLFHIFSILSASSSVMPSSRFSQNCWLIGSKYLEFMYLNHGFHYFSPEPGAATTISYVLEFEDGREETGKFPTKAIQPRLLYHRHFMLTEFLASDLPEDMERQKVWYRAYARNLIRRSGAKKVTLNRVRHLISTPERILAGGKLDDPEMFQEETLGTFEKSELVQNKQEGS